MTLDTGLEPTQQEQPFFVTLVGGTLELLVGLTETNEMIGFRPAMSGFFGGPRLEPVMKIFPSQVVHRYSDGERPERASAEDREFWAALRSRRSSSDA